MKTLRGNRGQQKNRAVMSNGDVITLEIIQHDYGTEQMDTIIDQNRINKTSHLSHLCKYDVRERFPNSLTALKYTAKAAQIIHQLCLLNQDGSSFLPSL